MGSLGQDIRYALRMMVKTPGLTAVLTITLALGIGASTTIFSVVNSVVLRPLPYEQPDRLVRVYTEFKGGLGLSRFWVSPPEYLDFSQTCGTCASTAAWSRGTASLSGGDRPVRIEAAYATQTLLPLLGVRPILGRWFDKSEDVPGGDPTVMVLGYDVWKRAFGADKRIVGRQIHLDAMPVTVIGVMPPGFDFLDREEAWVPLNVDYAKANRGGHYLNVIARLKPGVSLTAFRSELHTTSLGWAKGQRHTMGENHHMLANAFQDDLVGSLATTLWLLQGAVLLVLLISIVNVANLLLARSETRTREVAVRHALGASRTRLMRQFLTESMLLALLGGGLGVLVAVWAIEGVSALIPKSAPRASEISLDFKAVVFAVACAVAAAVLFGMAPILHARRTNLHGALKDGSNRMTSSKARLRVRRALVIGEIALAVILVIGCTVMVRSFVKLQNVQLGMKPDHLLTFEIELPTKSYPGTTGAQFWTRLQDRLRALPGVKSAGLIDGMLPARPINANDIEFPDKPRPVHVPGFGVPWNVDYWQVLGEDTLDTIGARVIRGRNILPSDTAESPSIILVNEAFAKRFYPNEDAIGKRVVIYGRGDPGEPTQEIVGIVADMKQAGIDKPSGTEIYIPWRQYQKLGPPEEATSPNSLFAVIRTVGEPTNMTASIHHVIAELDPSLPVSKLRSMDDLMWEAVARPRFLTFLLASFAGIALLLAAVGIYGVMAHTVAQRTHEIGLRVALGAQPRQVRAMVLRQAATLVAAGVATGLTVAVALQLLLESSLANLFYGERLSQPILLAGVALAVTFTALLATWIPARRATRVEPTVALRSE
jgi:putative ABC transport system permease protein